MIRVEFETSDGGKITVDAAAGISLLEAGQGAGLPLEGTCEGQMACSTCHVIIAQDWFGRLPPAAEDEEDMLDLTAEVERTSRLSCQIILGPDLDGMQVRLPRESRDMQWR